jgi:hypothetical protein
MAIVSFVDDLSTPVVAEAKAEKAVAAPKAKVAAKKAEAK